MASTTRDRILDALQDVLVRQGLTAVTLEGVAAGAGVSKGGLLYHFPSKAALLDGLIRRLAARADQEFREAAASDEGVVRSFLRTSVPASDEEADLYWSLIAAVRSNESISAESRALLGGVFSEWSRLLRDEVGDPVLAEIIRLTGDGMYLSSIAGLPAPDPDLLRRVIDRLTSEAEREPRVEAAR